VIGQCLASLLSLGPRDQLPFVERFLESDAPEIRAEAAGALAESHDAAAVETLKRFWQGEKDAAVRSAVLRLLGASPVPAAAEFLLSIVEGAPGRTAAEALSALAGSRHRAQFRDRAAAVVAEKGDPELARIMDSAWIQDE
jgi:HEAT repeat protein